MIYVNDCTHYTKDTIWVGGVKTALQIQAYEELDDDEDIRIK